MTSHRFFKMATATWQCYFRFRFWRLLIRDSLNICADQISAIYLNSRLRYYYLSFLNTNGRHVGTLLPVSIFTFACHSACAYTKFRPNRSIRDVLMTSYPFFKMAAVSHIEFSPGNCRPPTKCKGGSQLGP